MPRFNGTGPMGQGPGTGWGLGPCGSGMRRGGSGRGGQVGEHPSPRHARPTPVHGLNLPIQAPNQGGVT